MQTFNGHNTISPCFKSHPAPCFKTNEKWGVIGTVTLVKVNYHFFSFLISHFTGFLYEIHVSKVDRVKISAYSYHVGFPLFF
jgi:hypothetical protein